MLYKAMSKIYLAGEYAILKKSGIAVILPVEKYTYLDIQKSDYEEVLSDVLDKDNLIYHARKVAFSYANKYEKFKYRYTTELYENNMKLGLGSSASIVVLTIKAILSELGINFSKDTLFKLSVKAMLESNSKGSMGDIACIVYEKLIAYESIDKNTFEYSVKEIKLKNELNVELIHTRKVSSTSKQIEKIDITKKEFDIFYKASNKYVNEYIEAIENSDSDKLEKSIKNLSSNLEYLEKNADVIIHNDNIKKMIGANKNTKISGSGNGDFIISVNIGEKRENKVNVKIRL
ncbi:mevalonate kinase family protein [Oceanivirga miroungae]|uniref:phosphomevalonate kinase n=1 Tax=Oceanivirga miroungae TaxID=1130046 RepID=A0A6I8M758_9FUSO|nr:hypothetical protein [Oceanivirga miroungae]VWL85704.1 phosphomevalonate kinase [Oceanivirga miroungae]